MMKHIYAMRVVDADNQSRGGFQYPRKGEVSTAATAHPGGQLVVLP